MILSVVILTVSLHSNKDPMTEVGPREWGIALIGLTILLYERV